MLVMRSEDFEVINAMCLCIFVPFDEVDLLPFCYSLLLKSARLYFLAVCDFRSKVAIEEACRGSFVSRLRRSILLLYRQGGSRRARHRIVRVFPLKII